MAKGVRVYNGSDVSVQFGPVFLSGFADGTFVTVERDEDLYSLQVGTDGEGTRSASSNTSATITVVLMQSSGSNTELSGAAILDSLTGVGIAPLIVSDGSGDTVLSCLAWIQKTPAAEFGREATTREWVFRTNQLLPEIYGGNTLITAETP